MSMNDVLPAPVGGHYSASKAALAIASTALDAEIHPFGVSVTGRRPRSFRTDMAAALGSYEIDAASPYAAAFGRVVANSPTRLRDAGDPDGRARRRLDAEGLARLLRDFVIGLTSSHS